MPTNTAPNIMITTKPALRSNTHKLSLWTWTAEDTDGLTRTEKALIEHKITSYLHSVLNRRDYWFTTHYQNQMSPAFIQYLKAKYQEAKRITKQYFKAKEYKGDD